MSKKLTNEIIDERIKNKNLIRIGSYVNIETNIEFKCKTTKKTYSFKPSSVLYEGKCPNILNCRKCFNSTVLSNEIIDERINNIDLKIIRIDDYINNNTSIKFRCLIGDCGFEWYATPSHIINSNIKERTGCPNCGKNAKLNNRILDKRLEHRNIKRVGDYIKYHNKLDFLCLKCNQIWPSSTSNILAGCGCPICASSFTIHKNETRIRNYIKQKYGETQGNPFIIKTNNRKYHIDFVVNGIFIEYNGEQHYKSINFFGGEEKFLKQQKRDQELRDYCLTNNIILIEIPYWLSHDEQYKLLEGLEVTPKEELILRPL